MTLDHFTSAKKTTLIGSKIPGTKRVDHNRAVKMYERGAGDRILPSDLRPPYVLKVIPTCTLNWSITCSTSLATANSRLSFS